MTVKPAAGLPLLAGAVLALGLTCAGAVQAVPVAAGTADATYVALRSTRPDGRVAPVKGLVLDRDVFHFEFEAGAFHFLAPVAGRTIGAVFLGQGRFRLTPATPAERRQLALSSGAGKGFEALDDRFDELVLLFADDTAQEIIAAAPSETRAPDPKAKQVYERWLKRQRTDFQMNLQVRLLEDLLNSPGLTSGVFMALLEGRKLLPALAVVDPNGAEALGAITRAGAEDTMLYVPDPDRGGAWYLCDRRAEVETGHFSPAKRLAHALHYSVETTIQRDTGIAGLTTIRFQVLSPGLRVLPIHLLERLRISTVSYAVAEAPTAPAASPTATTPPATPQREPTWRPAAFVQEAAKEDSDPAVVFPEPLAAKSVVLLRITYQGDSVLTDIGDRNFVVAARTSWYANLGVFSDPATFELVYRVPEGNEVVSVGKQVELRTEGRTSTSVWRTDTAVQVAGFNYGKFRKLAQREETSGIELAVFTNERSLPGGVNTGRLAQDTMADAINAARVFSTYFGPLADPHVAITQQPQLSFGQSWPSLIFLPYLAFLTGTDRMNMGLLGTKEFADIVGFHEFAHQWWGHLVGIASYRDTWLEEGFAEFSAALALQHTQGWGAYEKHWRDARGELFATNVPGSQIANIDAGPIVEGERLATRKSPYAYEALIYYKGAYVLHMLRMMMWDFASPVPDARFIAMMKDYASSFAGKSATTADFQRVVERHLVPAMNATGDGKMDWFFRQWVYGTEAPRYAVDLKLEAAAGDQVRVKGKIAQEGVSSDFRALVPIYLELDKEQYLRVGVVPMVGTTSAAVDLLLKPPKKPRRVLINARSEVLARP
jgi:Peptidase family M1 domain